MRVDGLELNMYGVYGGVVIIYSLYYPIVTTRHVVIKRYLFIRKKFMSRKLEWVINFPTSMILLCI